MKNNKLDNIVNSTIVQCPNIECPKYGKESECNTHLYTICELFSDWYSGLSSEEILKIYHIKP